MFVRFDFCVSNRPFLFLFVFCVCVFLFVLEFETDLPIKVFFFIDFRFCVRFQGNEEKKIEKKFEDEAKSCDSAHLGQNKHITINSIKL